ncbi:MAG: T9SS type A sorting domain-containing protein [Flavobacteriales bacterium]|nr:T9SS type A sorting domain-containing protein [Flavobacteriales bacterium]
MKKIYLCLIVLLTLSLDTTNTFAQCGTALSLPWSEGFANGGAIPTCWTMGGGEPWLFNTAGPNHVGNGGTLSGSSLTNGYYAVVDASGTAAPATLTSPLIDISSLTVPQLAFFEISDNEGFSNSQLDVEVWDGAAWNLVGTYNTNTTGWERKEIALGLLTFTGPAQVRFTFSEVITPNDFYDDIAIDDVTFEEAPTCPAPNNLGAITPSSTTANLSWSETGSATEWEIEWGLSGFAQGTGNTTITSANPSAVNGLLSSTTYDFYVSSICGAGDTSSWSGPFTFNTPCASFTAPFLEEFNVATLPNCWTETGPTTWEYGSNSIGGFAAYGAANVPDHSVNGGGTFIGMDGSDNTNGEVSVLLSPMIDVSPLSVPTLSYWVFSNNTNDAALNKLIVELFDGASWQVIDSIQTNLGPDWVERITDLTNYSITGDVQVRYTITGDNSAGGSTFYNDIMIDDVKIYNPPTIDIAITEVVSPIGTGCSLTSTEDITISVLNVGINDTANFDLSYQINGGTIVTETVTTTLESDSTMIFTFTGQADLSALTTFNIVAWVSLTNDESTVNDTIADSVTNYAIPLVNLGNDTTICAGVDLTLDATAAFTSYIWSDGSTNSTLVVNSGDTYVVTVFDAVGCSGSDAIIVSTSSFIAPSLHTDTTICVGTSIDLDAGTYDAYLWEDGSTSQTFNVTTTGVYTVTVSEASTSCTAATSVYIEVLAPTSTFTMPAAFCESDPALTLTASPVGGNFSGSGVSGNVFSPAAATAGNYDIIYDYSETSTPLYSINQVGTFAPLPGTGTNVPLGDDQVSPNLPIGFAFNFFGLTYTDFYISSNGFLSFQDDGSGCCAGQVLPNTNAPNNLIAFQWSDLNPNDGGTIEYLTVGVAPNRVLIININGIPHYGSGGTAIVTTQILLYEGSNIIEIHTTDAIPDAGIITQGIENSNGTIGYSVPGRNGSNWSATNDFVQFVPGALTTCYSSDTVNVDVFATPVVDLGLDTAICDPSIYTLDAGNSGSTYVWNDGSTNQTLAIDTTGSYGVTITSPDACVFIDSIYILDIAAPIVDLGSDIDACIGDTVAIGVTIPSAVYAWNTGDTTSTIGVSSTGQYIVSVTKCSMVIDTIRVTFNSPPLVDLGQDRVFCYDEYVELDAGVFDSYLWSVDGSTNQLISDSSVQCTYTLEMYDSFGDGWNGNTFDLYQDGVFLDSSTAPNAGVNTGSGPHFDYFTVTPGTMLSINHDNSGPFQAEVSYSLYDGFGNLVYEQLQGTYIAPATNIWSGAAVCPAIEGEVIVTVADINGCINSDTVNISRSNPDLDLGSDTSICAGTSLTADAGIHASYLWSDGSTNQTLDLLTAGTYFVTVTDSIGCTKTDSIVLGINALPVVELGNDTSFCEGSTYMIDAGAGMAIYSWSDGQTNQMASAVLSGTFSVTITDGNGCSDTDTINVTAIKVIASITATDATCGNSDGSATALVSAGINPYSFLWSDGATTDINTGLIAGFYDVTATDSYGCSGIASVNILNANGPQISSATVTPNLCFGSSDGAIDITAIGGATPYTYAWNNGSTDMNISGLIAGNYDVTVSDISGCEGYATEVLTDPTLLTANTSDSSISCIGSSDGLINALVSGGTSGYTYLWNNGSTDISISGLAAGDYSYTATDANGCIVNTSITLGQPSAISLTTASTDANCNGDSSGGAIVSVSGGTPAYMYMWNNGSTTSNAIGLVAGSYDVTVTDSNGCMEMISAIVGEPSLLTVAVSITDATCGNADGAAIPSVTGGTSPYFYNWSNGGITSSLNLVVAGNYDVTVSDFSGCTATSNAVIINSNGPVTTITPGNPVCYGSSDGYATANTFGGATPYAYMWSNGSTSITASGLMAGNYQLTLTDGTGCLGYSTALLSDPASVSISASSTDETNAGANNGTATAAGTGGSGVFTYAWSNGGATDMVAGLAPNIYTVTASDANGCSASASVTVAASTVTCGLSISTTSTDISCNGDANGTGTVISSGAFGSTSYAWSNSGSIASISGLIAGTYIVTVTDSISCVAIDSVKITEPDAVFITLGIDTTICNNVGGLTLDPGAGFASYTWSTTDTTQSITVNATATYSVTVTDVNGCPASDDVNVTVDICGGVDELSNVFSVDIYPNPTKGEFVINVNSVTNTEANISIYSVEGKLVYSNTMQLNKGMTSTEVELTGIATGIYHIELNTDTESSIKKLIIK